MANDCCGTMKVVAKNKAIINRLEKIMQYKDDEYHCYRVFQFEPTSKMRKDGKTGLFYRYFMTDVAWGSSSWFLDKDAPEQKIIIRHENEKPIYGTSHYTSLTHLSKTLGFGLELWEEELGMCFCNHITCNHDGEIKIDTGEAHWDEDTESTDRTLDGYGEFKETGDIY